MNTCLTHTFCITTPWIEELHLCTTNCAVYGKRSLSPHFSRGHGTQAEVRHCSLRRKKSVLNSTQVSQKHCLPTEKGISQETNCKVKTILLRDYEKEERMQASQRGEGPKWLLGQSYISIFTIALDLSFLQTLITQYILTE